MTPASRRCGSHGYLLVVSELAVGNGLANGLVPPHIDFPILAGLVVVHDFTARPRYQGAEALSGTGMRPGLILSHSDYLSVVYS